MTHPLIQGIPGGRNNLKLIIRSQRDSWQNRVTDCPAATLSGETRGRVNPSATGLLPKSATRCSSQLLTLPRSRRVVDRSASPPIWRGEGSPNCRRPLARKNRASMIKTNHPVDGCQPVRDSSMVPRIGDQSSSPSSEHDHGCRR